MTPHNHAKPGDYAEAVLLPGDPLRAKWIAETFLDDAKLVNSVRNCLGYTGTWNGKPVSVQATGMGQPSTAIYVHELINVYGVKTLIRVGTCGGLNTKVKVRDLVIGAGRLHRQRHRQGRLRHLQFRARRRFLACCAPPTMPPRAKGMRFHVGNMVSSDIFYHPAGLEAYGKLHRARRSRRRDGSGHALHPGRPLRRQGAHHLHHDRLPDHRRRNRRRGAPDLAQRHGRNRPRRRH